MGKIDFPNVSVWERLTFQCFSMGKIDFPNVSVWERLTFQMFWDGEGLSIQARNVNEN